MRLISIPMSHYVEKVRFALARYGLEYTETAHLQGFHYPVSFYYGKTPLVPVLITPDGTICDSTTILKYLDTKIEPPHQLYPEAMVKEIDELEEIYDSILGIESRRWMYLKMLSHPKELITIAAQGAPKWEEIAGRTFFVFFRAFGKARLRVTEENVKAGLDKMRNVFGQVNERLQDNRPYLLGDRFTAADLSFACMAAPLILPKQYGVSLPSREDIPESMKPVVREFSEQAAGAFALKMFETEKHISP
jgi:glutathione S-transferase